MEKCEVAQRQWSVQLANATGQPFWVEPSLQKRKPWWCCTFLSQCLVCLLAQCSAPWLRKGSYRHTHTHKPTESSYWSCFLPLVRRIDQTLLQGKLKAQLMEMRIVSDTEFRYIKKSLIREHNREHWCLWFKMVLVFPWRHHFCYRPLSTYR